MRNSFLQLVFGALVLMLGSAAEELLPKVLGVGFPVLLVAVQFCAVRRSLPVALIFAVAAGAAEDALSSLPAMTSVSYFAGTALLMRWADLPRVATLLTYPAYQLWLRLWVPGLGGGVFNRTLAALPAGVVTAFAVVWALAAAERKGAIDGQG